MHPIKRRSWHAVQKEWDRIAKTRHAQIISGDDISYAKVLIPCVLRLLRGCDLSSVIDLGCGSGVLTERLARICRRVVGIDISEGSVAIAREFCSGKRNIRFDVASIESLSSSHGASRFTAAVANMTFVNCRDLLICLQSVKMALKPHGSLVMTVTHPCFWPRYWDYEGEAWFDYRAELMIEAPFQTSLCKCEQTTTHIHRSLECYFDCFQKAGLYVEHLVEPFPNRRALKHYPTRWSFPRFLGFRLKRLQ